MKEPRRGDLRIKYHPHYDIYLIEKYTFNVYQYHWTSPDHPQTVYKTLDAAKQELEEMLADKASKARPCVYYYPPDFEETT